MTSATTNDLSKIRRAFAKMFAKARAELPAQLDTSGRFTHGDWGFRYVLNECDGAPCLDLVAYIGGSEQLERILASGEVVSGPNFSEMVTFDPDVDADNAAARARFDAQNRAVADVMRQRGLL